MRCNTKKTFIMLAYLRIYRGGGPMVRHQVFTQVIKLHHYRMSWDKLGLYSQLVHMFC